MKNIKVERLIKDAGLTMDYVARQLFPGNKYPEVAIKRILSGEAELDASQIVKLSKLIGKDFNEIFDSAWKIKSKKGVHIFTNGNYKAILDLDTNVSRIYHEDTLFSDTILHGDFISVRHYVTRIENLIESYKQTNKN